MARVTVEDCLKNVDNRFELVKVASRRARQLELGAEATLPWENDKPTVLALREIAEGTISSEIMDAMSAAARAKELMADEEELQGLEEA